MKEELVQDSDRKSFLEVKLRNGMKPSLSGKLTMSLWTKLKQADVSVDKKT